MKKVKYTTHTETLLGDLLTPVSAYLKVRDLYTQSVLMESSDYHGNENSRSFIALNPIASIEVNHGIAIAKYPDGTKAEKLISEDYRVEAALSDFLSSFEVEGKHNTYCGLYGFTSFNAVRYFEGIDVPDEVHYQNDAPDLIYILYKTVIVFDHFNNSLTLVEMLEDGEESTLQTVKKAIMNKNFSTYNFIPIGEISSTLTDEQHKANIWEGIAHCLRGDVFQIVLSRRFVQHFQGDDFQLYRTLRSVNPSPYLFYFDFGGYRIFGSSPETHCRIEGRRAYIDPIAGTTKRTGHKDEDKKMRSSYVMTLRKMRNMLCLLIWLVMI